MNLYKVVVAVLCNHYNFKKEEVRLLFENKDSKYLLLLLLEENQCLNKNKLIEELKLKSTRSIDYNLKAAEEKLLVNREFRRNYFSLSKTIQKKG